MNNFDPKYLSKLIENENKKNCEYYQEMIKEIKTENPLTTLSKLGKEKSTNFSDEINLIEIFANLNNFGLNKKPKDGCIGFSILQSVNNDISNITAVIGSLMTLDFLRISIKNYLESCKNSENNLLIKKLDIIFDNFEKTNEKILINIDGIYDILKKCFDKDVETIPCDQIYLTIIDIIKKETSSNSSIIDIFRTEIEENYKFECKCCKEEVSKNVEQYFKKIFVRTKGNLHESAFDIRESKMMLDCNTCKMKTLLHQEKITKLPHVLILLVEYENINDYIIYDKEDDIIMISEDGKKVLNYKIRAIILQNKMTKSYICLRRNINKKWQCFHNNKELNYSELNTSLYIINIVFCELA